MSWKRNALRAAALAAGGSATAAVGSGTAVAYDGTTAATYANQYALGPNANWVHLHPNDCANFVSQALLAGGQDMIYTGSATWWADNQGNTPWGNNRSTSWVNADALRQYLDNGHNAGAYSQAAGSQKAVPYTPGPVVTGDVIFYNWDNSGGFDHVSMQVGMGTDPDSGWEGNLVSQHSTHRKKAIWHLWPYNSQALTTATREYHIPPGA